MTEPKPIGLIALQILARLHTERALKQHLDRSDEDNERNVNRNDTDDDESERSAFAVVGAVA